MDLKKWGNRWILHLINMWSRLTVSVFINHKRPSDVIDNNMLNWVGAEFGIMKSILTDNGGEFSSDEMREVFSILNVQISTTAANSPFQIGHCEQIHAVTDTILLKLQEQCTKTTIEVLLFWANISRNSLHMWHGFNSYQLVFGRSPNLLNVMPDKPPAFTSPTTSETEKHLNAFHAARESFIETESNERIHRALHHKVRLSETVFNHGDSVFFKLEEQEHWLGPAKVVSQDNKVIFLCDGGMFIRCSPNQLLKTSDTAINTFQPTTRGEEFDHPDTVKSSCK